MKKEENKESVQEEKTSKWHRWARKRWIYPAAYIGLAAIVIAVALFWMQHSTKDYSLNPSGKKGIQHSIDYQKNNEAVPVNKASEVFQFPVQNKDAVYVQKPFYDSDASAKKQEAALVLHDHTYRPNTGIDIARHDGNPFTVTASMGGTVTKAEKDPSLGYVVKMDNGDGVTTLYQSLGDLSVKKGDQVKQGEELGEAGTSIYNQDAGIHLHFEIRQDGKPLDPIAYFAQKKSDLPDQTKKNEDSDEQKQSKMDQDPNTPQTDDNSNMTNP